MNRTDAEKWTTPAGWHKKQIKIDEITNLGAVKVRLRSLLAALEQQKESANGNH